MIDRKSQFVFLTRHFFDRFFDKESTVADTDPRANLYPTIGLLASLGLMMGFFGLLSPDFVVIYSMTVTGFVMVYKWGSLFPDQRDYLILGSLPIRFRDLFLAKAAALCLFLGLFTFAANSAIAFMAPLARNGSALKSFVAHLAGSFGGSLFMALGFTALQGVLIAVLPQHLFRRISPVVQMTSIAALLTIFLTSPRITYAMRWLAEHGSTNAMEYSPYLWFIGVYLLPEDDPDRIFSRLALNALYGSLAVAGTTVVSYGIAYRRHARGILDTTDVHSSGKDTWRLRLTRWVDNVFLAHPVHRACFRFIGSILFRSARHQVFLAVYLAVGLSLGLESLITIAHKRESFPFEIDPDGMLGFPLTMSFFVVSALRAAFNIPYQLEGNWLFRLTDTQSSESYVAATRKWVTAYGIVPFMLMVAALEFAYWPWTAAAFHLAFESIASLVLLQALFFNFRKVPFTCSAYPGRINVVVLGVMYFFGFTTYRSSMVALERWLMGDTISSLLFFAGGIAMLVAIAVVRHRQRSPRLIYEEQSEAEFLTLGLYK